MKQIMKVFFYCLFFSLIACEKQEEKNCEKIAIAYLEKRGFSNFIRLNDKIPEIQFLSQRFASTNIGSTNVDSLEHSEFYECAQNQLCYNTFIEDNRVKSFYFSASLTKGTKSKRFSVGVFVDTVFLNPIGIIYGAPHQAISLSKNDYSTLSSKKEISNLVRMAFNDSLREADARKIIDIKNQLKKGTKEYRGKLHSDENYLDVFFTDYLHHIAILSLIQEAYFPNSIAPKNVVDFEKEDNVVYVSFFNKKIYIAPHEIGVRN